MTKRYDVKRMVDEKTKDGAKKIGDDGIGLPVESFVWVRWEA